MMDDFGNALPWQTLVEGFRSQGYFGWYDGDGMMGLMGAIDWYDAMWGAW